MARTPHRHIRHRSDASSSQPRSASARLTVGSAVALATLALIAAITFRLWPSPVSEPKQVEKTEASSPLPKRPATRAPKAAASAMVDACHDERLTADEIHLDFVSGAVPPGVQGGALTSGVYDAVRYQVFGDVPEETLARTFRQTVVIDAERALMKTVRRDQHGRTQTWTWTTKTEGSRLELTGECPAGLKGGRESVQYGMSGSHLVTSFEQAGVPVVVTYRRRAG